MMIFEWLSDLLNKHSEKQYGKSLFEIMNEYHSYYSEILNEVLKSIPSVTGIGNSWTGWSKPNPKQFNTGKNININNYKNYRLRNTAILPRTSYYRIRRKE